jgi:hypothetical protein
MRQKIQVKRSNPATTSRLLSALLTYVPGVWIDPRNDELITLYRLRYRMAMEEEKFDTAMIFLNKILELDPMNPPFRRRTGVLPHTRPRGDVGADGDPVVESRGAPGGRALPVPLQHEIEGDLERFARL